MNNDFANTTLSTSLEQNNLLLNSNSASPIAFPNNLNNQIQGFNHLNNAIDGQGGDDRMAGQGCDDIVRGTTGNDTLWGNAGKDILLGNAGNDILLGNGDNDTLWGNADNDTLWGGAGRDVLIGGSDRDIFALKPQEGTDTIVDFNLSERDRIGLAGGLTFDELTISQGTGDNRNDTLISTETGELLAILNNTLASTIGNAAFLTLGNRGLVTSQGDRAMRSDIARDRFRVDGTGIKIGVLSNSFNRLGGAAQDIASGDLPVKGKVLAEDLGNNFFPPNDEGRAMLQLIHDVAPGADLLFHTGYASGQFNSPLELLKASEKAMADGIRALAAQGAQIIVDDLRFSSQPMFQDGIIAQAIDEVVKKGVSYFTAAGNFARDSYQSDFKSAGFFADYGELHDFDPGTGVDFYQSITLAKNDSLAISFQWDSPLDRSTNDLDIYLVDNTKQKILAGSQLSNVGGDPIEYFTFRNDGSFGSDQFNLMIGKRSGSAPGLMKYVASGSSTFKINNYNTNSSTIYGNANARGVAAVGAAPYFGTPAYGVNPARLEDFSSAGGTPILFDERGNRLPKPEFRPQPKFVGPDNTNTTFFGTDIPQDADGFPNFPGTSAAAPHVAAVAALMLQANPRLTPAEINRALEQTALEMDDPNTPGFDVGFDYASGSGLIQADRAIAKIVV
ncbi:S8 family serine peptidase [Microcoleus sp. N9_A1]|uniref:S8 family serine peptidase n=1 Tax=Microcoleus sp. N9_A1 TaxID=3055380 RepID=UPI002FD2967B